MGNADDAGRERAARVDEHEAISVAAAFEDFLRDAEARGLRDSTRYKYRWVRARQDQLEADVRQSWTLDESSLLSSETSSLAPCQKNGLIN